MTTDASQGALGAELSQEYDEGDAEVITWISRTIKGPDHMYFTTEKGMLTVVWALEKLNTYLRGAKQIRLRTDHEASITFLKKFRFSNDRLRRWNLAIQDYSISPEYIPGKKNKVADFLSRHINREDIKRDRSEITIVTILVRNPNREIITDLTNLKLLQQQDHMINKIMEELKTKTLENYKLINEVVNKRTKRGPFKILSPEETVINQTIYSCDTCQNT